MTTRVITLWRVYVMSLTTSVSTMRSLIEIMFILKGLNPNLAGRMINRILHSWSFHMEFINSQISYEMTTRLRYSINQRAMVGQGHSPEYIVNQEYSQYLSDLGVKSDKVNTGS